MIFSSNQVLEVSGCLSQTIELKDALEFALKASGNLSCFTRTDRPAKCVYQITENGGYCVGWAFDGVKEGWNEYPFDFDLYIISQIIAKHLEKQELEHSGGDGSYDKGFIMSASIENDDTVKNPFYCIVEFRPFTCYYAK